MNTEDINIDDFQAFPEEPSVKPKKNKGKDTVRSEKGLAAADLDLTKKIEIAIRPHKQAMDVLIANLKKSYVTYRLTPLIQLFLGKNERFDILITALQPDTLFCLQKENLLFLTKESAFNYLIKKHWPEVFEKEVVPLSPIQGRFISINRCGITNVLLGPPNYHLYNDLVKEHYRQHLVQNYSWEFFLQQIKNERDPSFVKQWQKEMAEHPIFRLKSKPKIYFDSFISAQRYLQQHLHAMKDSVKPCSAFSLSYADLEKIKDSILKEQIYQKIKDELHSPISLGCFCRTRFRHAGLHLYKKRKGSSYTSFLCSVKRKIRSENDRDLSNELARIADYIEKHPMIDLQTCMDIFCVNPKHPEDPRNLKTKKDIIMLIKMGYVTQFENGELYVSPKQKWPIQKVTALKAANE